MLFGHAEEKSTAVVARNEVTRQSPSNCYKGGNISFGMEILPGGKCFSVTLKKNPLQSLRGTK
jgi:hypothetical protein